ncbi:Probable Co/Zn/Cd efflux system membrane fusion protein [hydrothermal vent metagenome]|uniref:Probable Co/Zn/Cd efflux system membrane fusion protein n=1 Tax=hydrothermal vent metagenome TaxID=652676 RepID=A0A3B1CI19_9ZZZZ
MLIMNATRVVTIVALAGAVASALFYYKSSENDGAHKKTVTVSRGDLIVAISASGAVEPNFQVEVKSKASGEILEFPYEPGDTVEEGEVLLKLDPKTEKRNLAQREADMAASEADIKSAEANLLESDMGLKRARKLRRQDLVADKELEAAIASYAVAKARVSQARAALRKAALSVDDAKERLSETIILSPIKGVIIRKPVERGQIISSGISSLSGGTTLCVVADMSRIFIVALVDETDIGKVSKGQETMVTVDAYPEKSFKGKVIRIYPMGEMRENITVFKVKIEALGASRALLKPKMTANVEMILQTEKNVLMVPEEAVRTDEAGEFVYVQNKIRAQRRDVKTGLSNGIDLMITEGLEEGEKILLRPPRSDNDSGSEHN